MTTTTASSGFSQSEIQEFKESFALFDTLGAGTISSTDFRAVLESLQESQDSIYPHVDKILDQLDMENDTMDFEDYLALMERTSLQHSLQVDVDGQNNFAHVFELFDVGGKGFISVEDLQRVAIELGEQDMTQEELEEMITRARCKQTGKVTMTEFTKMMTLNLFQKPEEEKIQET